MFEMETSHKVMIFGIFIGLLILRDMYHTVPVASNKTNTDSDSKADDDDEVRVIQSHSHYEDSEFWKNSGSKISLGRVNGPILKFQFCSSSGYKNYFDEFSKFIGEKYPEVTVHGYNYPPPTSRKIAAQLVMVLKLILVGSVVTSQYSLLHLMGIPLVATNWINQNKIYAALVSFFLANLMESQLISTGAFEIYFDDVPVWSRIQTGRIPNPAELVQIVDNHLKYGGRGSIMDSFDS